jgi:hypothetical protein
MDREHRLGDTVMVTGDRPAELWDKVVGGLDEGERLLCVDACDLQPGDADTFLTEVGRCARAVLRRGGHLTVVCPLTVVRSQLRRAGIPVLSDRTIAKAVLG